MLLGRLSGTKIVSPLESVTCSQYSLVPWGGLAGSIISSSLMTTAGGALSCTWMTVFAPGAQESGPSIQAKRPGESQGFAESETGTGQFSTSHGELSSLPAGCSVCRTLSARTGTRAVVGLSRTRATGQRVRI